MNSIDVKIANAKRRAEEERKAAQPKPQPTPEMNADDMRMIAEDLAKSRGGQASTLEACFDLWAVEAFRAEVNAAFMAALRGMADLACNPPKVTLCLADRTAQRAGDDQSRPAGLTYPPTLDPPNSGIACTATAGVCEGVREFIGVLYP
jgi:hypothetical protein